MKVFEVLPYVSGMELQKAQDMYYFSCLFVCITTAIFVLPLSFLVMV